MRSLVYVALQQLRLGPPHRGDFGAGFAKSLKQRLNLVLRSMCIALPPRDLAVISAKFISSSKPFDLVPFRGAAHVLLLTTNRMRIDMLFWRENNGTPNYMTSISRAAVASLASLGGGQREVVPSASPEAGCRAHIMRTETVGIPVHALQAESGQVAAAAALELIAATPKDTVLVTFVNPGAVPLARRSAAYRQSLNAFDYILPDGLGMCLAIQWLHGLTAERVSFDTTSLAPTVFAWAAARGLRVVLVGGAPGVADAARARIGENFPAIQVAGSFDGFGSLEIKARAVRQLEPDIVICGMGSGRQESFLLELKAQGWRGWGFTCGGYLDQLSRGMVYYPAWVDASNLRWAYRLVREPGRLWRRYLIDYTRFGMLVCAARISRRRRAYA